MAAPRPVVDRLLALLGTTMVVAGLGVGVRALASSGAAAAGPPAVVVLAPTDGASVDAPVQLEFRPDRPMEQTPMGWGVAGLHLHLQLDGGSVMPAPGSVVPLGNGAYRWSLPVLAAGEHSLALAWSDRTHRVVAGGGSRPIRVRVR